MTKRILSIVVITLVAAAVLSALIVGFIKYRDSQIPEQTPANTEGTEGSETESDSETDGKFDYSKAEKSQGLEYALNQEENGYVVVGMGTCTDKNVVLPETHEGKPVIAIGDRAFANADLESIAFSATIKSIGNKAFAGHKFIKIYFCGEKEDWLHGVKKDPGWRVDCEFGVIYPNDSNWEIDIT
ncbi:MAG: hypothetical protein IJC64_01190 [Clostridia bacterium]|nr:hypothetical protein [Clostridia bacterium]